jgi:hypothetical protein
MRQIKMLGVVGELVQQNHEGTLLGEDSFSCLPPGRELIHNPTPRPTG